MVFTGCSAECGEIKDGVRLVLDAFEFVMK